MQRKNVKVTFAEAHSILSRVPILKLSGKEIVITGGSGMIASYLVSCLIRVFRTSTANPPRITLLVRDPEAYNLVEFLGEESVSFEVGSLTAWKPSREYDYLIHAASPASPTQYGNPREIDEANLGFLERLQEVGFAKETLLISSGEVYGTTPPNPVPETYQAENLTQGIRANYPVAKLAAEKMLLKAGMEQKTIPKVVRLFHTFGPGMKPNDGRSFADFIWAAAKGDNLFMRSSGDAVRSFLYIEDAIVGILLVLLEGDGGEVYNLGSPENLSILEYAQLVALEAGVCVITNEEEPENNGYTASPIHYLVPDTRKIRNIGWVNEVGTKEGIQRTLTWAKETLAV